MSEGVVLNNRGKVLKMSTWDDYTLYQARNCCDLIKEVKDMNIDIKDYKLNEVGQ